MTKVYVPVVCQNGHEAVCSYNFSNFEWIFELPKFSEYRCPKEGLEQGWRVNGNPYMLPETEDGK